MSNQSLMINDSLDLAKCLRAPCMLSLICSGESPMMASDIIEPCQNKKYGKEDFF